MGIFQRPQARAWRPAPWWQSLVEAMVLAALPVLVVAPARLGLGGGMRPVSWLGAAVLLGAYGWAFNRLRPANPPAESLVPWRVGVYGGAVVAGVLAQVLAALLAGPAVITACTAVVVGALTLVSQWFEGGTEALVTARGLDRSPRAQSTHLLREARMRARGQEDARGIIEQERVTERWARQRREQSDPRADRVSVETVRGGSDLPEEEQEMRRVYRPADRLPGARPNQRKKKRRR